LNWLIRHRIRKSLSHEVLGYTKEKDQIDMLPDQEGTEDTNKNCDNHKTDYRTLNSQPEDKDKNKRYDYNGDVLDDNHPIMYKGASLLAISYWPYIP